MELIDISMSFTNPLGKNHLDGGLLGASAHSAALVCPPMFWMRPFTSPVRRNPAPCVKAGG